MKKTIVVMAYLALASLGFGQTSATNNNRLEDREQPTRFWQASFPDGGSYMVALDRISAVSRHKYLIDGGIVVDEVTIDTVGQGLVRVYYMAPLTELTKGSGTGAAAARIVDRGRELVDRAAEVAGTSAHNMVVKKFPETTHSKTIEYRVSSQAELVALHTSVKTAWENNRGRSLIMK